MIRYYVMFDGQPARQVPGPHISRMIARAWLDQRITHFTKLEQRHPTLPQFTQTREHYQDAIRDLSTAPLVVGAWDYPGVPWKLRAVPEIPVGA